MAKYIKKEMVDLHNEGQTIYTYRMQTIPMDSEDFISDCARNTTFSEAELRGVLLTVADHLASRMARGFSVTVEGFGTFKAQVGLTREAKEKMKEANEASADEEGESSTPHSRNARSLEVTGVLWKPAKSLVSETRMACRLERGGVEPLRKSRYTLEERTARARAFLEENTVMRISDYARITGLSRTKAAKELQDLDRTSDSGIISKGSRSSKVYIIGS